MRGGAYFKHAAFLLGIIEAGNGLDIDRALRIGGKNVVFEQTERSIWPAILVELPPARAVLASARDYAFI